MKKVIIRDKYQNKLLLLVYSFIFCVLLFFNQYWVTNTVDDTYDIGNFEHHYHGKYIVSLLFQITYGLVPVLFENIHINTWGQTGGAVIYSVFVIILMSTLSSLFFVKNKKNYLYPLIILINFIIFYYVFSMKHNEFYYYMYSKTFSFYCLFCYIFLFLFMKKMLTLLLNETKPEKKDVFELSLYSFLMGFSGDIVSCFAFLFLAVLLCFKHKLKSITAGNILIIAVSLLFSLYISSLNPYFKFRFSFRKFFSGITSNFDILIDSFNRFNNLLIDVFKQEFLILFLIILFLFVLTYCVHRKTNKLYNLLNFILIITFILYSYSLFFIGIGYFSHCNNYPFSVITHRDIWFQSKLFLLMIINIQAGLLLNDIKNNKKLLIITLMFLACISYKYVISEIKFINNVGMKNYLKDKTHIAEIKENHKNRYILERILLWYLYNDKLPILLKLMNFFYLYSETDENEQDSFISFVYLYIYFDKNFNSEKYNEKDIEYLDTLEEVIEKYYENGGREITEAEIKEADFNKLLDKNWVLYGK